MFGLRHMQHCAVHTLYCTFWRYMLMDTHKQLAMEKKSLRTKQQEALCNFVQTLLPRVNTSFLLILHLTKSQWLLFNWWNWQRLLFTWCKMPFNHFSAFNTTHHFSPSYKYKFPWRLANYYLKFVQSIQAFLAWIKC